MMALLTLEFIPSAEIMTTVRLATGGVSSMAGLSFDAGEDCKVCVTESLLLLMHAGCTSVRVAFTPEEDGLSVCLRGKIGASAAERTVEEEISLSLLNALVENVKTERTEDEMSISFRFGAL